MTTLQLKNKFKNFFRDKDGKVVVGQRPNVYIYVWIVSRVGEKLMHGATVQNILWWIGTLSLIIWAWLELSDGVNYFRRTLGLIILILLIVSVFKELI